MIDSNTLLVLKGRLMLACEAGKRMASNGDEPLVLEPQAYQEVAAALLSAPDDIGRVLAELDVLRGMVSGSWDHLFGSVQGDEHGCASDVGSAEGTAAESGGKGERAELPEAGGDVRPGGADGTKSKRPRARRNKKKSSEGAGGMDAAGAGGEMDSSEEVA